MNLTWTLNHAIVHIETFPNHDNWFGVDALQAKIFHYGSISLITEPCKSAHIAAAKAAKDAGIILSYDPNLRLPLWPSAESAREGILSIWDTADIIKVFLLSLLVNYMTSNELRH